MHIPIFFFVLGIWVGKWVNGLTPELILASLFPQHFLGIIIQNYVIPLSLFSIFALIGMKIFKGNKSSWFFLGASFTSIVYAGHSLVQIAYLYFENVGRFPFNVEGYVFPAVYTFKLFRATFFATVFGIAGHAIEILKNKKSFQKP